MDNGLKDQVKGKAKEIAGTLTGNSKLQAEGLADQAIGKVKEVGEEVKSAADALGTKIKKTAEQALDELKK